VIDDPQSSSIPKPHLYEQARTLLWLRLTLSIRRIARRREWGRLLLSIFSFLLGLAASCAIAAAVWMRAIELRRTPALVQTRGGPISVFATWLAAVLVARIWFALLPRGQSGALFDPRRFLVFAVPPGLVSALNFAAQIFDPAWLFFWPILLAIAIAGSRIHGMPGPLPLLCAEALCVWAVAGLLHLVAAISGAFDSRPGLRRIASVFFLVAAFTLFQLGLVRAGRRGVGSLLAGSAWSPVAYTPPGWAARFAADVAEGRLLGAVAFSALLFAVGVAAASLAHVVSLREARRPVEAGPSASPRPRSRGWILPGLPDRFAALFEKEAKTVLRVGWLQLVLVSVGFLVLRSVVFRDEAGFVRREPLLFAAVYAHLGVMELTTNCLGRDIDGARAWFLWPISTRAVLVAKNAVAYAFSVLIFAALVLVAVATGPVTSEQVAIALLAHLALFPLLATVGNVSSVLWPVPVRGMRLRRVRGSGPVGSRIFALLLLSVAAWGPFAVAALLGLPAAVAYFGEAVAMAVAYGGLLAFAARLFENRRESVVAALAQDE
jgi:ABC-2 type transport system permease protein